MRIAVDARFYGTENTGLGRYTTNVVKHLPGFMKDHTLVILLRKKYIGRVELPDNCEAVEADFPHYSLSEQVLLPRLLRDKKCDVVYTLHFNVPLRIGIPFIVTIHDLIKSHFTGSDTTTHSSWLFRLKRWGYELTIRRAVQNALHIIVPSNTVKNDILATFDADPSRISAVPEAPDDIFRKIPGVKSSLNLPKNYLLFVGNAYPHKNLTVILDALQLLPQYSLVIVAKESPFLRSIMSRYDSSRVRVLSGITDQDLVYVYAHAHALVTPSLLEGYGLPGIEASMVGTPVVASDIPVYREVYGDTVAYFDPRSADDLVRALKTVRRRSKKMSVRKIGRTWAAVCREIAEVVHESCSRI